MQFQIPGTEEGMGLHHPILMGKVLTVEPNEEVAAALTKELPDLAKQVEKQIGHKNLRTIDIQIIINTYSFDGEDKEPEGDNDDE